MATLLITALLVAALSMAGLKTSGRTDVLRWSSATTAGRPAPAAAPVAAKTTSVMIMNYAFSPAALKVSVGDTVTWTNMDTAPHTVTVTSGPVKFSSGNLQKGESFTYTFTKAGTYQYYCAVHPDMKASVTVTSDAPTPTPTPTPVPQPTPVPTPTPSPSPSHPNPSPNGSCGGLQAAVDAFLQHFYSAHLGESPGQQVADALSIDQYVKTHTVLVANMLQPVLGGSQSALDTFLQHVYAAHLSTSPGQQAADALAIDKYVKTHTVMLENMIKPLGGADMSSC